MLHYEYFQAINGAVGADSLNDADIAATQLSLREELMSSPHYDKDAKRNGVPQGFVITASDSYQKYKIEALPGEDLFPGDMIETFGETWIVVKTRVASPFQTIGLMWLCNCEFRWQNGTKDIICQKGVLDSGVYSTTKDGDATIMTADKQFKIYLPLNLQTERIYIDKRFATNRMYNNLGEMILAVQEITGYDPVSNSYGAGSHLLVLNSRSADYIKGVDNLELMICDYIGEDAPQPEPSDVGTIDGKTTIRLGTQRTYTADFEVATWDVAPHLPGVSFSVDGNEMTLHTDTTDELIGEVLCVSASNAAGVASLYVEVTN